MERLSVGALWPWPMKRQPAITSQAHQTVTVLVASMHRDAPQSRYRAPSRVRFDVLMGRHHQDAVDECAVVLHTFSVCIVCRDHGDQYHLHTVRVVSHHAR